MKVNIDEQFLTKISVIYVITNIKNSKVYVGSTVNLRQRIAQYRTAFRSKSERGLNLHLRRAVRKYGQDAFEITVCEIVEDERNLEDRERHWIKSLHSWDRSVGYNFKSGDEVGRWRHDESTKQLISHSQPNRLEVLQFSKSGRFIAIFSSLEEAARNTGSSPLKISKCCRGVQKSTGGFRWRLASEHKNGIDSQWSPLGTLQYESPGSMRSVLQIDPETGEVIKEYRSQTDAAKAIEGAKPQCISQACRGIQLTAYGFIWRRGKVLSQPPQRSKGRKVSDNTRRKISDAHRGRKRGPLSQETRDKLSAAKKGKPGHSPSKETRRKLSATLKGRTFSIEHRQAISDANKGRQFTDEHRSKLSQAKGHAVQQLNAEGDVIATFASQKEAEAITGVKQTEISAVCLGKRNRKKAGGFGWRFV